MWVGTSYDAVKDFLPSGSGPVPATSKVALVRSKDTVMTTLYREMKKSENEGGSAPTTNGKHDDSGSYHSHNECNIR